MRTHLQSAASAGFPSITALVTFAVSHLPLSVYCVSLKCVIAASWRLPLGALLPTGEEKWPVFKNVFVAESGKLKVNACAAVEARWLADEAGATGEAPGQN